jgi:hypothetical protein
MKGHMIVILIAFDELYNICFNASFCLELSTNLVQKKNTILPHKSETFSEQCGVVLVYSCRSQRELQEYHYKNHTLSAMVPHILTV